MKIMDEDNPLEKLTVFGRREVPRWANEETRLRDIRILFKDKKKSCTLIC